MTDSAAEPAAGEGAEPATRLRRSLRLPHLVFYGVGVTVGAGIFALIGEVVGAAGDHAPYAFLLAGVLAAATARSYALLAARYPRAAGAALYAGEGFGPLAGRVAGIAVAATGIISAAVVSLAFGGYLAAFLPVPATVLAAGLIVALAVVAWVGVGESIALTAIVTLVEVGTLTAIAIAGVPAIGTGTLAAAVSLPGPADLGGLLAAAALAFFAFIGFEDIVNMAEETVEPRRTVGRAIWITLVLTLALYLALALVAVAFPDRQALVASAAPMALIAERLAGWPIAPLAAIAATAMINGVLVQILMASRVLYGMAGDGLMPGWLRQVDERRRTPARATAVVAAIILLLALVAPLVGLAQTTSYVTLAVFTLVNFSLWRIARRDGRGGAAWGMAAGLLTAGLLAAELVRLAIGE